MKEICALIVVIIMIIVAGRYAYQTYKGEITPALSTWIIFSVSAILSLATYLVAEEKDWVSGILNTMDVAATLIIAVPVALWGSGKRLYFQPFERKYLLAAGLIALFWLISQNAFTSNLLVQFLIFVGYFPTLQNLITEKRNTESFFAWILVLVAGSIALYPAIVGGNLLSVIYAGRTVVMVSTVLSLMVYYSFRKQTG